MTVTSSSPLAFIGGGNMASAIIGGLLKQGLPATLIDVVEPYAPQRDKLRAQFPGVTVLEAAGAELARAALVVWAVKPQTFKDAALACAAHTAGALHLSVAAGIRSDSMAAWLGTDRIVRAMPNTPALVGQGMTGLYARPGASAADRAQVEAVVATTGAHVWLRQESDLDTVTALSGSGPAYVFYFLEAMREAGLQMGLDAATAQTLAIGTFVGASALAQASDEPPEVLRERVTSKGGTTYAALTSMETAGVKAAFVAAMHAAQQRAKALGDEFGG
ncbi:pyrroline-5-carboxylate reductase [Hydrogenophaga sp. OTU3427]|uniref:pyrroline-5-carboxylate reductase n=1 Tax=Hydrogenophaga sp. OTU3427 TaxID=3043856 RepID=UPI00313E11F4